MNDAVVDASAPPAWLPVLTEVLVRGTPPPRAVTPAVEASPDAAVCAEAGASDAAQSPEAATWGATAAWSGTAQFIDPALTLDTAQPFDPAPPINPAPQLEPAPAASASTPPPPAALPVVERDALVEQLMAELAPRLSRLVNDHVGARLRKDLDDTLALLLSQLDVHVRDIVRDAIADKLVATRDNTD